MHTGTNARQSLDREGGPGTRIITDVALLSMHNLITKFEGEDNG